MAFDNNVTVNALCSNLVIYRPNIHNLPIPYPGVGHVFQKTAVPLKHFVKSQLCCIV